MFNLNDLALCGDDVRVADTVIWKHPHLAALGSHIAIDDFLYLTTGIDIGDYCHISSHVSIVGGVTALLHMGNFSHLAAGAKLIVYGDENLGEGLVSPVIPSQYRDEMIGGTIVIGDFVSVLTNSVVAPGLTLGQGCVLAANSFANKNIPEWEIWGGSPARFIKRRRNDKMIAYAKELGYDYE